MATPLLFQPISFRSVTAANRIVVAPMCQYSAVDGLGDDWHIQHLGARAAGGAGVVMVEATHVSAIGRITPGCLGAYNDEHQRLLTRIASIITKCGSVPAIQIAHAGRKASCQRPWEGGKPIMPQDGGWVPVAPSAIPMIAGSVDPHPLSAGEVADISAQFAATARMAREAGFKIVELHAAHGYLLHSFLSPLSNNRNDEYGGDIAGRMRFPLEVFAAMRAAWPAHKPLGVRISATDWIDGGWTLDDAVVFCRELKKLGCDYICASSGGSGPDQKIDVGPSYQVPFARRVREEADMPSMAVGIISEALQAEQIIRDGAADLVALGRGMTYDPRWAWHAAETLRDKAPFPPQYARSHHTLRFGDFFSRPTPKG